MKVKSFHPEHPFRVWDVVRLKRNPHLGKGTVVTIKGEPDKVWGPWFEVRWFKTNQTSWFLGSELEHSPDDPFTGQSPTYQEQVKKWENELKEDEEGSP